MRTLALDTATPAMALGLWEDGVLLVRIHEIIGRGHAERLIPALATLPEGGRAERIVVGVGPGSFTGIRVGLAAARALALAWGAEATGLSTLALVAAAAAAEDGEVVALVNGGHGEAFAQAFAADPLSPLGDSVAVPLEGLSDWAGERRAFGPATLSQHLPSLRPTDPDMARLPRAAALATLPLTALYGRGPDACPPAGR